MGRGLVIVGRAALIFNVIVNFVPDYTASHNKSNNEGSASHYSIPFAPAVSSLVSSQRADTDEKSNTFTILGFSLCALRFLRKPMYHLWYG